MIADRTRQMPNQPSTHRTDGRSNAFPRNDHPDSP